MKKEKILYLLIIICRTTITILTGITFIQSKKIQMIETQLTSISTTPNENSTKDVSKKINELESKLTSLNERVNKVENNVSTSADELSGLKTDINNVKANFNSLITDLS